jgi:hypothetical protein
VPSSQTNDKVTVSAKSLEDVLAALQSVAAAIAANGTGNNGGGGGGPAPAPAPAPPTVVQARAILDYLAINQLLSRPGLAGRIVSASRDCQDIRLRGVPTVIDGRPVTVTKAVVTPAAGPSQTAVVQPPQNPNDPDPVRVVTVDQIDVRQPIVRIELHDAGGVPVALGPRLAPVPDPDDCDGVVVD